MALQLLRGNELVEITTDRCRRRLEYRNDFSRRQFRLAGFDAGDEQAQDVVKEVGLAHNLRSYLTQAAIIDQKMHYA